MTAGGAFRITGCQLFLPLLFAIACWFGAGAVDHSGYATADLADAAYALGIAAPLAAAFLALRFRSFTTFVRPLRADRRGTAVVLRAWWPLLIGGPASVCLGFLVSARAIPAERSAWLLLTIYGMNVLAFELVGLALSRALPVVIAVPAVAVGAFSWIAWTPSTDNLVLHTIAGYFDGCCTPDTQPSDIAVRAMLMLLGIVCLGISGLFVARTWDRLPRSLVTLILAAVLAAACASAAGLASSHSEELSYTALEPRRTSMDCHRVSGLRVCVYPENRSRARLVGEIGADLNEALRAPDLRGLGLRTSATLSESPRDRTAVPVTADHRLSGVELRASIAAGYVDQVTGCRGATSPATEELRALMALLVGVDPGYLAQRIPPPAISAARGLLDRIGAHDVDAAAVRTLIREASCPGIR